MPADADPRRHPLSGLRVVRLGHDPAAAFAGWLFANCGAHVVVPEDRSDVSWTRTRRAFLAAGAHAVPPGELLAAVGDADVVLTDPSIPASLGGDACSLTGCVEPVRPEGPYGDWSLGELELAGLGGATVFTHDDGGMPLFGSGQRYASLAGMLLFTTLVAEASAGLPPRPRRVVVRGLEVVSYCLPYATLQFAYNGSVETFEQSGPRFVVRCRDGWAAVYAGANWPGLAAMLGGGELLDDPRFLGPSERFAQAGQLGRILDTWAADRTLAEASAAAREHSVALAGIRSLDEVLEDPELAARDAWQPVVVDGEVGRGPRVPWRFGGRRPAPRHQPADDPRWRVRAVERSGLPLAGVRVVDLSQVWSGPMASRVLAALGADVVKVEGTTRYDFLRGSGRTDVRNRYPDRDPGERPTDRNAWFNTQNTDKRSVRLDLKAPRGRQVALALLDTADVLLSNFRPGVLERLELGLAEVRARHEQLVYVEMPGYGNEGRYHDMAAYGAQFEAHSGGATLTGWPGRPALTGFALSDPVAGIAAAAATVVALAARSRSGQGEHVEVAQYEAMLPLNGESFVGASLGRDPIVAANASHEALVHGIFRLASSRFVSVRADGPVELARLAAAVGVPGTSDPRSVGAAVARHVGGRTDHHGLAAELQAAGVAAAPVLHADEVFHDPELRAAGFYRSLDHPVVGRYDHPAFPVLRDGTRFAPRVAAPTLGQHTDEVLTDWLGATPSGLARDRERSVIA